MFELQAAGFRVAGRQLLQPLDLCIAPGQVLGLIGHNGSGKSTLLKILARQQAPSSGNVLLDGRPLPAWRARAFAQQVAYLPQQLPSADNLTVRELVNFGRYPWHGALGRFSTQDRAQVEQAMVRTATDSFAERLVENLSGGERQRVWLAMLLAQNSRYLLLDEPTSALDIAHQFEVLAKVRELSQELGLGVVLVLHDINMAARFCDRLIALHSGRLLASGTPTELMRSEILNDIYGIPMGVLAHPSGGAPIGFVH